MNQPSSWTDAELRALDVEALLVGGLAGEDGRLRPLLQGEGSVAAALRLEAAGVGADAVAQTIADLHAELSGIELQRVSPWPPELDVLVRAGRGELVSLLDWLALVHGLLRQRAAVRG